MCPQLWASTQEEGGSSVRADRVPSSWVEGADDGLLGTQTCEQKQEGESWANGSGHSKEEQLPNSGCPGSEAGY